MAAIVPGPALSEAAIQQGLNTQWIGRNLVYLPETDSTNDQAKQLGQRGAPDGTLVITDHQTGGRGRLGRRWEAPPCTSLLLSLLFRPPLRPHQCPRLTMVCGLAIVDAVRAETGLNVGLKWPNDILINGTKAGGILTELELQRGSARDSSARGGVEFAVVGIGLNVNLDPMWLPQGLLAPATSLSHALGHTVDRLRLLLEFLAALETRYSSLLEGHLPNSEWAQRLETLGQQVRVTSAGQVWEGVAEGVDPDGGLLVRLDDGQQIGILAGDVTLRAPAPELSRKGPYGTEKAH